MNKKKIFAVAALTGIVLAISPTKTDDTAKEVEKAVEYMQKDTLLQLKYCPGAGECIGGTIAQRQGDDFHYSYQKEMHSWIAFYDRADNGYGQIDSAVGYLQEDQSGYILDEPSAQFKELGKGWLHAGAESVNKHYEYGHDEVNYKDYQPLLEKIIEEGRKVN